MCQTNMMTSVSGKQMTILEVSQRDNNCTSLAKALAYWIRPGLLLSDRNFHAPQQDVGVVDSSILPRYRLCMVTTANS